MKITLFTAALAASLCLVSCDEEALAQSSAKGSTITTKIVLSNGADSAVGFTGLGTSCTNYNVQFYNVSTNTLIACVNTGSVTVSTVGTYTTVNSGGTSGLQTSGPNTIPYVNASGVSQPAVAANVATLFTGGSTYLKADGTTGPGSNLPSVTAMLKGNGTGGATAALYSDVVTLFGSGSCSGYLKSDGTCSTPSGGGASLPTTSAILKGNGTGGAAAAGVADVTGLFTGTGQYLRADGTTGTPSGGGASLPTTTSILKGDGAGGAAAATSSNVVSLFGSGACSGYLKSDGTCATPGGATIANTTALIKGNGSGNGIAAAAGDVVTLFGTCTGSQLLSGAGTCINAPPASIPSGTTASVPSTGTAGQLYNVTDSTSGIPYYFYNATGNAVKLLDIGPTGGLTMATQGQIDINTSVIPRLAAANAFTGRNSFAGATDFPTQASPASPASGSITLYANTDNTFHMKTSAGVDSQIATGSGFANPMTAVGDMITGGTSGAASRLAIGATGQVLTVSGGQPVWSTPASGPSNLTSDQLTLGSATDTNGPSVFFETTQTGTANPWLLNFAAPGDAGCSWSSIGCMNYYQPLLGRPEYWGGITGSTGIYYHYIDGSGVSGLTGGHKTHQYAGLYVGWYDDTDQKQLFGTHLTDANLMRTDYGLQLNTGSYTQPTCSSTTGGAFWYAHTNATTKDSVQVCAQDATGTYAWRTIY